MRWILMAAAAVVLASCAAHEEAAPDPAVASVGAELDALASSGRDIAEAQCAACHAVGEYGASPNPDAPVFRTIFQRYRADVLEQELIEGIRVSHPMPEFQFNPQGTDALIQYLRSIQGEPSAQ
ncbi:MAG: c-type cytochrome [Hyphomonadaceae bacterium]